MPTLHVYVSEEDMHTLIQAAREKRMGGHDKTDATTLAENAISEECNKWRNDHKK